jgi:hypothetical protein
MHGWFKNFNFGVCKYVLGIKKCGVLGFENGKFIFMH